MYPVLPGPLGHRGEVPLLKLGAIFQFVTPIALGAKATGNMLKPTILEGAFLQAYCVLLTEIASG